MENFRRTSLLVSETFTSAQHGISCLHAEIVIEELCRNDVRTFFVSPGARCIPLVLALEQRSDVAVHLVNDERSAAFAAQGFGRSGTPACLISTSGTAVQNYLPGVTEAFFSRVPLILLTADRPYELLHGRANQTIWQKDTFRDVCCMSIDVPAPESRLYPEALLADIDQLVAASRDQSLPVHLNVAYRKPFTPSEPHTLDESESSVLRSWRESGVPFTSYLGTEPALLRGVDQRVFDIVAEAQSPLIVCGPLGSQADKEAVTRLAAALACPVVADINSDLRFSDAQEQVFGLYNAYLRRLESEGVFPDLVVLCGDRIVSEEVRIYLTAAQATVVAAAPYAGRQDLIENESIRTHFRVPASAVETLAQTKRAVADSILLGRFRECEKEAREKIPAFVAGDGAMSEAAALMAVFDSLQDGMALYLSASLLFREADFFVAPRKMDLITSCNRGATGIDGVLSSAVGFSMGHERPTVVCIGEQALLHDLNALGLLRRSTQPLFVFLVKNGGGAIFDFFDLGRTNKSMKNVQEADFESLVRGFGLAHFAPSSGQELQRDFKSAMESGTSSIFELNVDGAFSVRCVKTAASLLL